MPKLWIALPSRSYGLGRISKQQMSEIDSCRDHIVAAFRCWESGQYHRMVMYLQALGLRLVTASKILVSDVAPGSYVRKGPGPGPRDGSKDESCQVGDWCPPDF